MRVDEQTLLTDLLRAVSRSFYLTLRAIPSGVRRQIGLAYLLARATDTIADTDLVEISARLAALRQLRDRILGENSKPVDFSELAAAQPEEPGGGTNSERVLLLRIEEGIAILNTFSDDDRARIREALSTIVSGQSLDLERFGAKGTDEIKALLTEQELDDYTYRVAGCVGEYWTKICRAHLFPDALLDERALLSDAVRFGQGLQLVNILRDLPRDLRQGRCYVPTKSLALCGMQPGDLLNPANEPRLRPVYNALLDLAEAHLKAGWAYTNALPRSCIRVRLACAWPILIGRRTLEQLRGGAVLQPERRIKISRSEVRRVVLGTLVRYPFERRWRAQFQ